MSFDAIIIQAHEESLKVIGESFTAANTNIAGVFSEIERDSAPELAGYQDGAQATVTLKLAELSTAYPSGRIQGKTITRAADSKVYRISRIIENGGGIVDLELTHPTT